MGYRVGRRDGFFVGSFVIGAGVVGDGVIGALVVGSFIIEGLVKVSIVCDGDAVGNFV